MALRSSTIAGSAVKPKHRSPPIETTATRSAWWRPISAREDADGLTRTGHVRNGEREAARASLDPFGETFESWGRLVQGRHELLLTLGVVRPLALFGLPVDLTEPGHGIRLVQ